MKGVSYGILIFVDMVEGVIVKDVDGNMFIDFVGVIGIINVGYSYLKVKEVFYK